MGAKYEFDKTRMEFRKVTHSVWTVLGKAVKYFLVTASLICGRIRIITRILMTVRDPLQKTMSQFAVLTERYMDTKI